MFLDALRRSYIKMLKIVYKNVVTILNCTVATYGLACNWGYPPFIIGQI